MKRFPFYKQPDTMDCGATCLKMIAKFHGKTVSLERLRTLSQTTRSGASFKKVAEAAETIGFRTLLVKTSLESLIEDAPLPCIVYWNAKHFTVVHKFSKRNVYVADPAFGLIKYTYREFLNNWISSNAELNTKEGICLLLEPTPSLLDSPDEDPEEKMGFNFLIKYVKLFKKYFLQLGIGVFLISVLQFIFPFLTQSVVDIGIQNKDIHFLYLVLLGQLFLFLGRTMIEITRGWILLHVSTRINISLISDFLIKLMRLPISFFDSKMTGDIMQRIGDHARIDELLTVQSLNFIFSAFNFIVFGVILAMYSLPIFLIFITGTTLYFIWVSFFMKKRSILDHKKFEQLSNERSVVMELIQGMQEIKLHNAEQLKRWNWENLQIKLFNLRIKGLRLEQWQGNGSNVINELKNIIISFYSAKLVVDGSFTLGMMLSVTYIIGQLNSPVSLFLSFIYTLQDARLSLNRLAEIHNKEDEEPNIEAKLKYLPQDVTVSFNNVSYSYMGSDNLVLKDINFEIAQSKITAIVGASGSGKTTLMKLLLRFYEPNSGKITVGNTDLTAFSQHLWRENCGSVMQEGFIFNDSIARNIAVGVEQIDTSLLLKAVEVANIREFIESLPLSYNTKIGAEGMGLSGGQKQRILIARAVYKNPEFLFFDEATSALDANNEKVIMKNLNDFFEGRTAVVIAHRLSTVKNADQIIVLDNGQIIEKGTHNELIEKNGAYFNLVKNQLELEKLETQNLSE
ncbi:peptidase domain-containing ABC transporter [Fluviicola chungangensis]|uniref:Peptidase domain-containing ABC transporter n=1 Tax=Fluviicola chungangensis TaxID=2597671 RepID=A0A556MMX6_9FLAO|nr:peptidase domain-containing ABC transporter [Fluviicola chungangensis]TSJ41291.1 peptidase domain-containing ABC transporter [Fluviicola chungangensis]